MMVDALLQKPMRLYLDDLPRQIRNSLGAPSDSLSFLPLLAKLPVIMAASKHYPLGSFYGRIMEGLLKT
jgi:hypothetical protein